jgi:hypothetical protein
VDPDRFDADDVPPDRVEVGGFEDLDDWYDDETIAEVDRWGERNSVLNADDESHVAEAPPFASRLNSWSRRTALGAVMSGMAMGLQDVFENKEKTPIIVEVDDDGLPTDLPIQLLLDPDDPSGSLALVHRTGVKPPEV